MKKKDNSFYKYNKNFASNREFVINFYGNYYKFINDYLRNGKLDDMCLEYTEKYIKSSIWCLHDALTSRESNVINHSYYYGGKASKFPKELGIGSKFIFAEFISLSPDILIALSFSNYVTLLVVRIENNNNPPGFYCYDITELSQFSQEKEVLITSNCIFEVTNIEIKTIKEIMKEAKGRCYCTFTDDEANEIITVVYLTCLGNIMNNKNYQIN